MSVLTNHYSARRFLPRVPSVGLAFGLLFALAIALRAALYDVITSDYTVFVSPWLSYAPYLLDAELVKLSYVAVAVLSLILIIGATLVQSTRLNQSRDAAPA